MKVSVRKRKLLGDIPSKLFTFIDCKQAVLMIAVAVVLYILAGRILSLPWFDGNVSYLRFLSSRSEALSYLGVIVAVMIPIWVEAVHKCNEDDLVGVILHRVLRTRESLYTAVTCIVLIMASPRASYLYAPVILFTVMSFNLAHNYFMVTQPLLKGNKKVAGVISKITRNVLYTIKMSDDRANILSPYQERGRHLLWDTKRKRVQVRARSDGVVVNIRLRVLKLLRWGLGRLCHCSMDIDVFQSSTVGCGVRQGDVVAVLFVDESIEQVGLLLTIAEHAFVIKDLEQVSILDKFINNLSNTARKIDKDTVRGESERLLMLYDAMEHRYDKFLGGNFSSYIPASADIKMFSYISSFNSQVQNIGGRLSETLIAITRSSIASCNLPVLSSVYSKVSSGYRNAIKEKNFVALSRYDRVCRETVSLISKYISDCTDENDCNYVYRGFEDTIITPLLSSEKELLSIDDNKAIALNRISFLCSMCLLCVDSKNQRYLDLFKSIIKFISSMAKYNDKMSDCVVRSLIIIRTYILAAYPKPSDVYDDQFWHCVNDRKTLSNLDDATRLYIDIFDSNLVEKYISDNGLRGADLFDWGNALRMSWLMQLIDGCRTGDCNNTINDDLAAKLSKTNFFTGGATEWRDSVMCMIVEKSFSDICDDVKSLVKSMAAKRIENVQNDIKTIELDTAKIDDFCKSINNSVNQSEWVCALMPNGAASSFNSDDLKVSSRMLSRSMCLDRRAFVDTNGLTSGYEYSVYGLGNDLGGAIVSEMSRYVFRYCLDHSEVEECIPDINDDLFNDNYIVLNGYTKWETRRDYFERAPATKRLAVHCDGLQLGIYIIPNDALGYIVFRSHSDVQDGPLPVVVQVSNLSSSESAKSEFVQQKIGQGYNKKEADSAVDIMLLLRIVCIFEYCFVEKQARKIVHIPECDD